MHGDPLQIVGATIRGTTTIRGEQGKLPINCVARVTVRSEVVPKAFDVIRSGVSSFYDHCDCKKTINSSLESPHQDESNGVIGFRCILYH
ncbi:unnamed protein product [Rhizophagus irregularis]|nr:unnamed protein product [Rhizophagus irregularis]